MKLTHNYCWPDREFDLGEAVDYQIDGVNRERGTMEQLTTSNDHCRKYLAALTSILHKKNILDSGDISELLPDFTEVSSDDS